MTDPSSAIPIVKGRQPAALAAVGENHDKHCIVGTLSNRAADNGDADPNCQSGLRMGQDQI